MATIAPWLIPTDVLGAMRSGAGVGLQLRQQQLSEEEAEARHQAEAERLQFAKENAAETLAVQRTSGAARLALAASNAAAQAGYHKEAQQARTAAQALRERAEDRLQKHQTFQEEQAKKTLTGPIEGTPIFFEGKQVPGMFGTPSAGGKSFNLTRIPQEKPEMTAFQKASLTRWQFDAAKSLSTILPTDSPEYTNALSRVKELTSDLLSIGKTNAPVASGTNEIIRTTKDGRRAVFNSATKEFIRYAD